MPFIEKLLLLETRSPIHAPSPILPEIPQFLLLTFSARRQLAQKLNCTLASFLRLFEVVRRAASG
jgi:hypothetical protein